MPRCKDEGYILVAVLGIMLLLTGLMAAGSVLVRSALGSAKIGDEDVAMAGLAQGGLEIAAYQLFTLKIPPRLVQGRRVKFGGGTVTPAIVDEGGKVDLNGADPKLLTATFESVGVDSGTAREVVAQIVAIRGPTSPATPSVAAGSPIPGSIPNANPDAPAPQAPQAPPPTAPATDQKHRRGFQSVDDLRDLRGLTAADLKALAPRLTVYNPDGKVDVLSADPEVLMAIPGLSKPVVDTILARRSGPTKAEAQELEGLLKDAKDYTKTVAGPAFTVRIATISAIGRRKTIEAVVAASKSPTDPYYVLDWRN